MGALTAVKRNLITENIPERVATLSALILKWEIMKNFLKVGADFSDSF